MTFGETIPFDLKDVRTVFYDLHDPDKLEAAQEDLAQKVKSIQDNPSEIRNPITVARNVNLLQQSDDPEAQAAGAVLSAINDLRDEMRLLGRRVSAAEAAERSASDTARERIRDLFERSADSFTTQEVAAHAGAPAAWTASTLRDMVERKEIFQVGGKWTSIPF
jgi:hypothetical protein